MHDLCVCIYAQAIPTQDVMFMLALPTRLEHEADNIHSEMTSYYISNKAADSTALSECIEQEIMYKNKHKNCSDTALTIQTSSHHHQGNWPTKICSNPICLNPNGHLGSDCWEKGGAMEGKRDQVLTKQAKVHEEQEKKKGELSSGLSASGVQHDKSGC